MNACGKKPVKQPGAKAIMLDGETARLGSQGCNIRLDKQRVVCLHAPTVNRQATVADTQRKRKIKPRRKTA
jgi:hypothetical protein